MAFVDKTRRRCGSCGTRMGRIHNRGTRTLCGDCANGRSKTKNVVRKCKVCGGSGKSQRWVPPESDLSDCSRCGGVGSTSFATIEPSSRDKEPVETVREKLGIK